MDLVAEDDCFPTGQGQFGFRFGKEFLAFCYSGGCAVDFDKAAAGCRGYYAGDGGFSGACATPQDHGGYPVGFDEAPEDAGGADEVLPINVVEGVRAHSFGEGSCSLESGGGLLPFGGGRVAVMILFWLNGRLCRLVEVACSERAFLAWSGRDRWLEFVV